MDNELQKKKSEDKGKDNSLSVILFSSLAVTLLFIVELYLMIAMPQMLLAIAVVGVVIVGCTYVDLVTVIKRLRKKEQEQSEQYASILKSEKAAYLLIRKYFDEIEEQLTLMEDKFSEPFQEVVAAQKATARVTINRNKENTDALMNSNDKLLELVFHLESKLDEVSGALSDGFAESAKDKNADVLQKQGEMSNQLRELELSLRNEILQAVNKLTTISPQVMMAPPQMMTMQQPIPASVSKEPDSESEPLGELGSLDELGDLPDFSPLEAVEEMTEPEPIPEMISEPELEPIPEVISEPELEPISEMISEAEPIAEELPPMPDLSDPNRDMSTDEINALLANMAAETASLESLPDAVDGENAEDDSIAEPESAVEPEMEPDSAFESEPEPEPIVEEKPPMPDLSDPNKVMSPDEIAALLANMGDETTEPEPEPEPVVEEKPPMPDLSDPNKVMSPDEIAALLANMGDETTEPEPEPEPEPVAEEKPPMPDLSDPNKVMSPDEIAALFANLG